MGCHVKNPKDPFEVQCLFNEFTEDFSLYFHYSSGQQDLIAHCPYEKSYECFFMKEGFVTAQDNDGVLKITVPDTFSKQAGQFICQKEGHLLEVSCQFPPSENFSFIKSVTSEVGLRTAGNENFTFGNSPLSEVGLSTSGDDVNQAVIIGAAVGAVALIIFVLVISILLFKKYKSQKGRECPENNTTEEDKPMADQGQITIESENVDVCSGPLPEIKRSSKRVRLDSEGSGTPLIDGTKQC